MLPATWADNVGPDLDQTSSVTLGRTHVCGSTAAETWPRFRDDFAPPPWLTEAWLARTRRTIERVLDAEGLELLRAEEMALEAILWLVYRTRNGPPSGELLRRSVREVLLGAREAKEMPCGIAHPTAPPCSFEEIDEMRALFARSDLSYRQRRIIGLCLQGAARKDILEATGMTAAEFHAARDSAIRVLRRTRDMLRARRPDGPVEWCEISHAVMLGHNGPTSISWISADGRVHRFPQRRNWA